MNGVPLLLLWGEKDPWIRPMAADKIQALYPSSRRVSISVFLCVKFVLHLHRYTAAI